MCGTLPQQPRETNSDAGVGGRVLRWQRLKYIWNLVMSPNMRTMDVGVLGFKLQQANL